jgi:hypothetical protein
MSNQLKNPTFWCFISFVLGLALGVWGLIKEECIGENCWVGSGFLLWAGSILIIAGLLVWAILSNRKRTR